MRFSLYIATFALVLCGCFDSSTQQLADNDTNQQLFNHQAQVGFFAPGRVNADFAPKVDIQLYDVHTVEALQENLQLASEQGLKLFLAIALPEKQKEDIKTSYIFEGDNYEKKLSPQPKIKMRSTLSRDLLTEELEPFINVMQQYPDAVEAVFLGDEPYLNGISFQQLETLGNDVRFLLDKHGLEKVKVGAIFASAMFNAEFAEQIEAASSLYVRNIDTNISYLNEKKSKGTITEEEENWLDIIGKFRLTTYDKANNMYIGGGLPESLDIIGFDFYFSTLLIDGVHNKSLQWFAKHNTHPSCAEFENINMSELRKKLSFWGDKAEIIQTKDYDKDKEIIDKIYTCRTESTLSLLKKEISKSQRADREILLISESSANGLMSFNEDGSLSKNQNMDLTNQRVTDEVRRAFKLAENNTINHLMFFTYEDGFDGHINLKISGAENIKETIDLIYNNVQRKH